MKRRRGPYRTDPAAYTVRMLCQRFRESPTFRRWAPSSRSPREAILWRWERAQPDYDIRDLTRGELIEARDTVAAKRGTHAANNWLKVIRLVLAYAVDIGWLTTNPAAGIKALPGENPDGHRTWREDEIAAYLRHHREGPAHVAMMLMLWTAASRADVVQLGWQNVREGRIEYRRQKMRGRAAPLVSVPIMPPLQATLDALPPGRMTFLETVHGRPRSAKSLGNDLAGWVKAAGLDAADDLGRRLTCHGLRKACARRLAESGATDAQIMAWTGHSTRAMVTHYSSQYDRAAAADQAAERLGNISSGKVVRIGPKRPA